MNHKVTFQTFLKAFGNNTGIVVPPEQLALLSSSKRPTVTVDANGYRFESVVASMKGEYLISFSKAHREASGFTPGQALTVSLSLLETPRTVTLPKYLETLLETHLHQFYPIARPLMEKVLFFLGLWG